GADIYRGLIQAFDGITWDTSEPRNYQIGLDTPQFPDQDHTGMNDAVISLLNRAYSYLDHITYCHLKKFLNDEVGCIVNGQVDNYRDLVKDFVELCKSNQLQINSGEKIKRGGAFLTDGVSRCPRLLTQVLSGAAGQGAGVQSHLTLLCMSLIFKELRHREGLAWEKHSLIVQSSPHSHNKV
ncbi:hypothetical protein Z043_115642, partial [Scleropages formosus]